MNTRLMIALIAALIISLFAAGIIVMLAFDSQFSNFFKLFAGIFSITVLIISIAYASYPHVKIKEDDANPSSYQESLGPDEVNDTGVPVHDDSIVSEEAKRHGVLLECKNAWLSDRTFYYCRNFYHVYDMVAAKVDENFLAIKFSNGKTERFGLATDSNVEDVYRFKLVSKSTRREAYGYHSRAQSRQWVRVINSLIWAKKNPPKQDAP